MDADQFPSYRMNRALLPLVELLGHLAHELVIDADVMQAVAQSIQDATRRTADDRTGRPEDDGADDDTEPGAAHGTLGSAEILGLVDLDPEPGPVGDRGIDDLHVRVDVVDLLDPLQESPRLLARVEHECHERLTVFVTHRSSLLP